METGKRNLPKSGNARQRHEVRQQQATQKLRLHSRHAVRAAIAPTFLGWVRSLLAHWKPSLLPHGRVIIIGFMLLLAVAFGIHIVSGGIFLNVWSMGISLGGLSIDEATTRLVETWHDGYQIGIAGVDLVQAVAPSQLGLRLDARRTAEAARAVALAGIPFGYDIQPIVSLDTQVASDYLEALAPEVAIRPYNAGYDWEGAEFVSLPGKTGRELDIERTLAQLSEDFASVVSRQRIELVFRTLAPEVADPSRYFEAAHLLAAQPFSISAYDPYTNETINWTIPREDFVDWLEAEIDGLGIREAEIELFLDNQSRSMNLDNENRYLDNVESLERIKFAVRSTQSFAPLRIRYRATTYVVVAGDTGYRIARKTGIPFSQIEQANPQVDLSVLSPGDVVNLPSRDVTVPLEPIASKRILVNLDTQWLRAFENGVEVFSWAISSGIESAPTTPGIFQILSHENPAYGSSYLLCDGSGCGQWEMEWFMGIYEVVPGLMNGFHGSVLLPDNSLLGDGNVGVPYTLGCVMSRSADAQLLYDWAEEGTIVEIISSEFEPQSDLGRLTVNS